MTMFSLNRGRGRGLTGQPNRTHPADFENPGRVKVLFKKEGRYLNPTITNRAYIQSHPTD